MIVWAILIVIVFRLAQRVKGRTEPTFRRLSVYLNVFGVLAFLAALFVLLEILFR